MNGMGVIVSYLFMILISYIFDKSQMRLILIDLLNSAHDLYAASSLFKHFILTKKSKPGIREFHWYP